MIVFNNFRIIPRARFKRTVTLGLIFTCSLFLLREDSIYVDVTIPSSVMPNENGHRPLTTNLRQVHHPHHLLNHKVSENEITPENVTSIKKIVFWTLDNENRRDYGVGLGGGGFRSAGCPVWQCEVFDRWNLTDTPEEDFDAVVFFEPAWSDRSRPAKRSPHQRYVYWNLEAPGWLSHYNQWERLSEFFNWTMTYRHDSDIVHPYGWIVPVRPDVIPLRPNATQLQRLLAETKRNQINHAKRKTKKVAWFVSNCASHDGRNEYVDRLKRFIPVDIYGRCGTFSCPRSNDTACVRMLQRDYKFYLAFENSLCLDYVTEKFFSQMHLNIIPVVFDLHNNHQHFAPPHSYINALDFPSVNALADYLILLDRNDTLYNEYFWWKKHYTVHDHRGNDFKHGFCDLCAQLHNRQLQPKVYTDLSEWWGRKSQCLQLVFDELLVNSTAISKKNETYYWRAEVIHESDLV